MFWITGIIMRFAPIGVIGLVAPIIGEYGASVLLPLLKTIVAVAVACIIHAAIVYSTTVRALAKINTLTFFKGIAPAAAVAFSTASSEGYLAVTLKSTHENIVVSNKINCFVLPLAATIIMDGTAIYQGGAVIFIAPVYDLNLSFTAPLTVVLTTVLASIGTAGVPG